MLKRVCIKVRGIVQGVGFRPYIYKLADIHNLSGFILNNGDGVKIEVEGVKKDIDCFFESFTKNLPPLARVDNVTTDDINILYSDRFEILNSTKSDITTSIPTDVSICDDCLREMNDKIDRRYRYPFINCTNCGVRYSIVDTLPYDRKNSSMKKFEMCESCSSEYHNPKNRRYHAQPISCFDCGPKLSLVDVDFKKDYDDVIVKIVSRIKNGECVAIKGVGGFHLVCDATNDIAVKTLREKKQRISKPFAVMVKNLNDLSNLAYMDEKEKEILISKERPVVLLDKKDDSILSPYIAPHIDKIGVFLAYTPLHLLILEELNLPIVATSANISGEPIIIDEEEVWHKLSHIVDTVLTYDRTITHRCDDSVCGVVNAQKIFYRLARGYAPLSIYTNELSTKKILAVGANQKSSITLVFGDNFIHSPYIGDLDSIQSVEYFEKTIADFKKLYDFIPDIIVCDKHPNYESTKFAKRYKEKYPDVELIYLQHHYAHILSVMVDREIDSEVLGFCFDGTGYGDDGRLWGGEVFIASNQEYKRVGYFKEFLLLGGEKAIKEPDRLALSIFFDLYTKNEVFTMNHPIIKSYTKRELETFYMMYEKKINSPSTSSVGRLFDVVYALMDIDIKVSYEGESGLIIETFYDKNIIDSYPFYVENGIVDYTPMILEILQEKDKNIIASRFINTLANIVLYISKEYEHLSVVLAGGVFQNTTLLKKVINLLENNNITYYIQNKTSLNDGSISLGQAYFAKVAKKDSASFR